MSEISFKSESRFDQKKEPLIVAYPVPLWFSGAHPSLRPALYGSGLRSGLCGLPVQTSRGTEQKLLFFKILSSIEGQISAARNFFYYLNKKTNPFIIIEVKFLYEDLILTQNSLTHIHIVELQLLLLLIYLLRPILR